MPQPRVQIVILNWNGWADTIHCLESVFALDYPAFGVVVCDNGSTDGSVERICEWAEQGGLVIAREDDHGLPLSAASRPPIRWVEYDRATAEAGGAAQEGDVPLVVIRTGANLGFAGGNNVGLRYLLARDDAAYAWLLNNDTVVAPSSLRELVARAESDPASGVVGGTLLELHEPDVVQEMGGATVSRWHGMVRVVGRGVPAAAARPLSPPLDYVSGGCMLVRRDVLTRVGLLDERFFLYGEDVDWGLRIRDAGYRLLYAPSAHVWHKGSSTFKRGSPNTDYHNARGSLLLIHKRHPRRLPFALAYSICRCFLPKAVRWEWDRVAAIARSYRDVLRHVSAARSGARVSNVDVVSAPETTQRLSSGLAS